jgi:hypothetical protein
MSVNASISAVDQPAMPRRSIKMHASWLSSATLQQHVKFQRKLRERAERAFFQGDDGYRAR